ncbi:MAG: acyl-CoA dehydrogenase family protein [Burkholderiales bacterium]
MSSTTPHLQRAAALVVKIAARAADTEAQRKVSPASIAELRAAGLTRMGLPTRLGGVEVPVDEIAKIVALLARGCASTAWVCGIFNDHAIMVAKFDPRAADDVWGKNPDALIAAGYHPSGTVEKVDGGYRLAGTWGFASGCDYADWLLLGSFLPIGDGPPTASLCLVPRSEITIEDNWQVMGLAGTGSKNLVTKGVFVPAYRTLPLSVINNGVVGERPDLSVVQQLPQVSTLPFIFPATGLGIAESLLEAMIEQVSKRSSRGVQLAEIQSLQLSISESAAEIECARMLMERDLAEAMATVRSGRTLDIKMRARNRRDQAYMGRLCRRAVDRLFAVAGSQGNFDNHLAQRSFRDMVAVSTHVGVTWEISGATYGRVAFGLDPATVLI